MATWMQPRDAREQAIRAAGYTGAFGAGGADAWLMQNYGNTATPTAPPNKNTMNAAQQTPLSQMMGASSTPAASNTSSTQISTAPIPENISEDLLVSLGKPRGVRGDTWLSQNPDKVAAYNNERESWARTNPQQTQPTAAAKSLWNVESATEVGRLLGLLSDTEIAQGGLLDSRLASADAKTKSMFDSIALPMQKGERPSDLILNTALNYGVEQQITKQKADPAYGSLTKAPYKEYKPFTMADYQEDPGYKFRLEQGNKAIDAKNSAMGNFFSGRALKEASDYNSNMASDEFGKAYQRYNNDFTTGYNQASGDGTSLYNRLMGLSNQGLNASGQQAASNVQNSNQLSSIYNTSARNSADNTLAQGGYLSQLLGASSNIGKSTYGNSSSWTPLPASAGLPWLKNGGF